MMTYVSKEMIFGSYAVIILVLGLIGYFIGKKKYEGGKFAGIGMFIGAIVSIILWYTVGKKMAV